jgi:hypothetical protein
MDVVHDLKALQGRRVAPNLSHTTLLDQTLNIGVIGYGYWGPKLVHNFQDRFCCIQEGRYNSRFLLEKGVNHAAYSVRERGDTTGWPDATRRPALALQ